MMYICYRGHHRRWRAALPFRRNNTAYRHRHRPSAELHTRSVRCVRPCARASAGAKRNAIRPLGQRSLLQLCRRPPRSSACDRGRMFFGMWVGGHGRHFSGRLSQRAVRKSPSRLPWEIPHPNPSRPSGVCGNRKCVCMCAQLSGRTTYTYIHTHMHRLFPCRLHTLHRRSVSGSSSSLTSSLLGNIVAPNSAHAHTHMFMCACACATNGV